MNLSLAIRDAGYVLRSCEEAEFESQLEGLGVPQLVVLCMDDIDTSAILGRLRRYPDGAAVPVMLFSASQQHSIADVIEYGADSVLTEPLQEEHLRGVLLELAGAPGHRNGAASPVSESGIADPLAVAEPVSSETGSSKTGSSKTSSSKKSWFESTERLVPKPKMPQQVGDFPALDGVHRTLDEVRAKHAQELEESQEVRHEIALSGLSLNELPEEHEGSDTDVDFSKSQAPRAAQFDPNLTDGLEEELAQGLAVGNANEALPDDDSQEELSEEGPHARHLLALGRSAATRGASAPERVLGQERQADEADRASEPPYLSVGPSHSTVKLSASPVGIEAPSSGAGKGAVSAIPQLLAGAGAHQGKLSQVELPRLLWVLSRSSFDGYLELHDDDRGIRVNFVGGQVVHLHSASPIDSLAYGLWQRLRLTSQQFQQWEEEREGGDSPASRDAISQMVERGWLKSGEAQLAHQQWLEDTLLRWWILGDGEWNLVAQSSEGQEPFLGGLDIRRIFLRSCAQHVSAETAKRWLGDRVWAPRRRDHLLSEEVTTHSYLLRNFEATNLVQQLIAMADGRPLRAIAKSLAEQGFEVKNLEGLCYALEVMGIFDLPRRVDGDKERCAERALDEQRLLDRLGFAQRGDYFGFLGVLPESTEREIELAIQTLHQALGDEQFEVETLLAHEETLEELRQTLRSVEAGFAQQETRDLFLQSRLVDLP